MTDLDRLLPDLVALLDTAVGHISGGADGEQTVAPIWQLPRSAAPAGASTCARARDLLAFARVHMNGGLAADGTRIPGRSSFPRRAHPHALAGCRQMNLTSLSSTLPS
jgi:hypothetical protein